MYSFLCRGEGSEGAVYHDNLTSKIKKNFAIYNQTMQVIGKGHTISNKKYMI